MKLFRYRKSLAAGVLAILALSIAGALWWHYRPDPEVVRLREMGREMMAEARGGLPSEQQMQRFRQFGEEIQKLSPEQRRELMSSWMEGTNLRQMFQAELDKFFALPKNERVGYLDKQIDRMESFRKLAETGQRLGGLFRRGERQGARVPPGPERRLELMKRMLDRTTPEERAKMSEFFQQVAKRREERGLPAMPFPGRI